MADQQLFNRKIYGVWGCAVLPQGTPEHLGISASELQSTMPMYCHVHSTFFSRYGWMIGRPRSEQNVADVCANTPPPRKHFSLEKKN
ncbi:hypothetical protein GCK32_020176, partial [Trichostrongylus colubriformis]